MNLMSINAGFAAAEAAFVSELKRIVLDATSEFKETITIPLATGQSAVIHSGSASITVNGSPPTRDGLAAIIESFNTTPIVTKVEAVVESVIHEVEAVAAKVEETGELAVALVTSPKSFDFN